MGSLDFPLKNLHSLESGISSLADTSPMDLPPVCVGGWRSKKGPRMIAEVSATSVLYYCFRKAHHKARKLVSFLNATACKNRLENSRADSERDLSDLCYDLL